MWFYRLGRAVVKVYMLVLYQPKVIGLENIPERGSVLLCPNHISNMDPPIVATSCKRSIHFMAKKEIFEVPVLKHIVRWAKVIPVNRGAVDRETLRQGLSALKNERILCIFPEGTAIRTGELGKGMAGAGFFALKSNTAVVPCAIMGPYKFFGRPKIVYGKPIDLEPLRETKASAEVVVDTIMNEIGKLIENNR